jgi:ComF family protein
MGISSLFSPIRSLLSTLLDLTFPPLCLACGAPADALGGYLCPCCAGTLSLLEPDDLVCRETRTRLAGSGSVDGLVSLYPFEKGAVLQSLIHALKYEGMTAVGGRLGAQLGARVNELHGPLLDGLIIPIPLHKARLRERGYNQAGAIAAGVSRSCGIPVQTSLLVRRRNTVSQTTLTLKERCENIDGAFSLRTGFAQVLKDRQILLVDDVITTGSTVVECARVLKQGGVGVIFACSIALAVRDS